MKCRICGNETDNPEYQVKELQFGLGDEFTYFRCSQCGCLQITEIPEDMSRYYPKTYYSYNTQDKYDKRNFLVRWLRNQRDRYSFFKQGLLGKLLLKYWPTKYNFQLIDWNPDMRILDVGCGNGAELRKMRHSGFRYLTGTDPYNEEDIRIDKDFNIYTKSIDQIEGEYDVILLSHSLEHMPDQQLAFENIHRLLAPQGKAIINIPVFCPYMFDTFGKYWFHWDPPRHFYIHSLNSFQYLCDASGFSVKRSIYDFNPVSITFSARYREKDTGERDPLLEKGQEYYEACKSLKLQPDMNEFCIEKK